MFSDGRLFIFVNLASKTACHIRANGVSREEKFEASLGVRIRVRWKQLPGWLMNK